MTTEIKGSIHLFMINLAFCRAVGALGTVWKSGFTDQYITTFGPSVLGNKQKNENKKDKQGEIACFPVAVFVCHKIMVTDSNPQTLYASSVVKNVQGQIFLAILLTYWAFKQEFWTAK